jgi:hypothetical protein
MNARTMIRTGLAVSITLTTVAVSLWAADPKPTRAATQAFMRQKLGWSQATLEGLTLEKFDLVSKNAIRMRDMTQSNQWFTLRQPDYLVLTTNFQKSVDALYMAAVDKKLDAATEAYMNVTRNCVECHRLVRTEQRKNAGQPTKPQSPPDFRPAIQ